MDQDRKPRSVWSWIAWTAIAAVVLAAILVLPGRTEPVTRERLAEARRLWEQARIESYDLELETRGAQTGRYHVKVRDGKLRQITRNGQPASPAAGEYWTVDGLFQTIEEELDLVERSDRGGPAGSKSWLRMRCDPKLGYPTRFVAQVPGRPSSVEIRVLRLEPVGGE